ncbi:AVL9 [Bugula neritina]|uniref:AVL9 n=1 Tax=Bugula neritina TaxID=10212 RepID=A0A7J7JFQ8_BUGNE|nr:AVL9 [Bugula neritina]
MLEWEGGDEWIRAQFKDYLQSLMASVLAEDNNLLEAFNIHFVNAWKSTHNYKVWRNTVQQLEDVIPGHPYQGGVTLNDVKLQLARSERGRKINAAVDLAGKTVGEALTSAKSFVSSWWSNKSPTDTQPPTEDGGT